MTNQFFKGESALFSIEIRDAVSNSLIDPTSVTITVMKPSISTTGTTVIKVKEVPMARVAAGKYNYSWLSDEAGSYQVVYTANNNSIITISKDSFVVIN
jgi:hypothetical protein